MKFNSIFDMVGNTPSIKIARANAGASIYLKLEGSNPTGSVKDRACVFILQSALSTGSLVPGKILLDASSGNFACALTFYGGILGFATEVAVSSKLTTEKGEFLKYFGATIHTIGDFTIQGNEFCRQLSSQRPQDYFFLDQLHNWQNPKAHFETTGPEILSEFPDLVAVVCSLGSGGTLTGVAQYLKEEAPGVRIVAVECASGSRIPGTGTFVDGDYITPFILEARTKGLFDYTVQVTEAEAAESVRLLLKQGIFAGLQTGAGLHAATVSLPHFGTTGSVVVISGDTGWKSLDKLSQLTYE
jgi:[CysO sulfur-carrier protein]-thiocarboxylate-dependent cysteine synthase